ncbi:MAG: UPF0182 family protein [Peptococcaceae bacterium]|nr:UPF0182 family protein [Peptococcaceae bacterium]
MKSLYKIIILFIIIIAILAAISGLYEDWLWFKDLGYDTLFWTPLLSKIFIQLINGSVLFIIIAGTLFSGRHAFTTFYNENFRKRIRLVEEVNRPVQALSQRKVTIGLLIISAIISILVSFIVSFTGWLDVLSFLKSSTFNYVDPLFNKDLGFYVFKLPFFYTIYNAFFPPIFILTLFTAGFYVVTQVIKFNSFRFWRRDAITISTTARRHLGILLAIIFALKAFGYYLDTFSLVYSQSGHVSGAGFTDVHVSLPILRVLMVISIVGFIFSLVALVFRDSRLLTVPIPLLLFFSLIVYGFLPPVVQSLIVIPNELQKEAPYIANEIELTRFAYGLDKIKEQDYSGVEPLTGEDLKKSLPSLQNIRLNDPRPMRQVYTQKQGIRQYYKFNDIDIDRYTVDGDYRQVLLSAREINIPDLQATAQTFVNTRLKYTHGFGITASFANEVTSNGLPAFAIYNIPPETDFPDLTITEPRIYFGELTNDWVVVNTKFKEFDYPIGNENAENSYQGKTGIPFTPFNKFMLSLHRATPRFYLSTEITSESKLLLHRNINERVQKLTPFIVYDSDPYVVIDEGRIKWIMDGYTTASTIPYSCRFPNNDFNYIRNSVKVVIDAYHGTVDFYVIDPNDPILKTYSKIFPGVFKDISAMSDSLKAHLRYPETLFKIQCQMLNTYHMTNVRSFYNKEDAWSIAKEIYGDQPVEVEPYFMIMDLPGEYKEEFVLIQPFTPASSETNTRNNLIAWLAARMDGEHYGELVLYRFPKNIEIDGPFQIESRIDQNPDIARQLALWNQQGSSVIRGNLLVLPIGGNLLYVEPLYLQSRTSGSIPEMKRVIVAFEDKVVMENSFDECLNKIFGKDAPVIKHTTGETEPLEEPDPTLPSTEQPTETDITDLIDQIDQIRKMLDSLEEQLTKITGGELPTDTMPAEDFNASDNTDTNSDF